MYRIKIYYHDFGDYLSYTEMYVSEDKKELLKEYLRIRKLYDDVSYKLDRLVGKPYCVYKTYEDRW